MRNLQLLVVPTDVSWVQVEPEFADVQMLPLLTTAASFEPSADEVIEDQVLLGDPLVAQVC